MKNKTGPYLQKLMTIVLDSEQEIFIRELAISELKRVKESLEEFLFEHQDNFVKKDSEKAEKILLQEEK
jgi:hypothetical protein|tara:strand:- start:6164 stop:6370 length:207 start_codon:yes stop_codon:yes gene_type:complete